MLPNYLKVALRNLRRQKTYAVINIGGLAVGLSCCLLLGLFIRHELSYDRFHDNADRIGRLVPDYHYQGNVSAFPAIGAPWGPALVAAFPEVEQAVRFRPMRNTLVRRDDHIAYERGGLYADSTIFEVFSFPLVQGNPQTALRNPNSVVLTEQMAARFFGTGDPIGQTLTIEREDYIVTGVAQDVPEASHFEFNFLLPFAKHAAARPDQVDRWGLYNYFVYLLLDRPESIAGLEAKFPDFEERNLGQESALRVVARLQPLTSIYLHSNRGNEFGPTGNVTTLSMLGAIAVFILLIACINFMNLATARSANRAREVGIRKAVGAQRGQLAFQFLAEAVLVCFFALLMA
ncbi:MAG TPA: ABC transporter permease, partial [Rhodothermales bacterium]|nr:ABC transporter permease [Rhodothermales bacterium]